MKKLFIFIALFFSIYIIFAQDFKNTYWDEDITTFINSTPVSAGEKHDYIEKSIMLGCHTDIYYFFENANLKGVGYDIPYSEYKLNSLLKNLDGKFGDADLIFHGEKIPEEKIKGLENYNITELIYADSSEYYKGLDSITGFFFNEKSDDTSTIAFAHYRTESSDICVHSYIPGHITVIYLKHEDNF